MSWLSIVERELVVRSRQGATYWTRCGVAAAAFLLSVQNATVVSSLGGAPTVGAMTFAVLSWVGFIWSCAATTVTADCVSSEGREGTLGLLFLTDLRGCDVVLGKLVAAGTAAFYALVGFLPALAFALLYGGISGGEMLRTSLALVNLIFLALAAGLLVSTRAQHASHAFWSALAAVSLLLILPALAGWLLHDLHFRALGQWLNLFSPARAFALAREGSYRAGSGYFWISLVLGQLTGWGLLALAAASLERNWRNLALTAQEIRRKEAAAPRDPSRLQADANLLERSPVGWLASRLRASRALVWLAALMLLVGGGSYVFLNLLLYSTIGAVVPSGGFALSSVLRGVTSGMNLSLSLVSAALYAWVAGRFFFEARRGGELELLLSTPLGARDVVEGFWLAIWRSARGPLLVVTFLLFLQALFMAGLGAPGRVGYAYVVSPVVRALDVIALFWVGMWFGLTARKPSAVVIWTAGLVIGLPWVVSYFVSALAFSTGRGGLSVGYSAWLGLSPVLHVAKDVFFITWAARRLRRELRTTAPLTVGEWLE